MKLSIDSINELGSSVGTPIRKTVEWKLVTVDDDGEVKSVEDVTTEVYIRQPSCLSAFKDLAAISASGDAPEERASFTAERIASYVCDKDGAQIFTPEDISGSERLPKGMPFNLMSAIGMAINEVTQLGND